MSLPGNGIFVVRGEMSTLMTAMRRGSRWNSALLVDDEKEPLLKLFGDLKHVLNRIKDLRLIDANVFLSPFLEVIRTDETTGAITSLALAAINKFLSYGLIDPTSPNLAITVENIVDAVTHARFMGTDQSSDGVTLFRVVQVLHTLLRSPEGSALSNEAVCEVMLSCFKICFEPRLNELLRRSSEQALKDMVLLLFMRLPQFAEENSDAGLLRKFQMMAASMDQDKKKFKMSKLNAPIQQSCSVRGETIKREDEESNSIAESAANTDSPISRNTILSVVPIKPLPLATTPATPAGGILDMQGRISQTPTTSILATSREQSVLPEILIDTASPHNDYEEPRLASATTADGSSEYINSVGVRFTQHNSDGMTSMLPYGLPCVQELFRFLILLCNPLDKQNTDTMMHMGLSLLTVAFEVGADNIGKFGTLQELVKDDLCRNLIALMSSERLTIFAADLHLCFLLFESLRGHLKFQLEAYIKKLSEIISNDNPKTPYEKRELALDNLLQLFRIPGFVAELYINYDCDIYCSDVFENLTKLLSKFTLSATNAVCGTHIIAMDALISVIDGIEQHCIAVKNSSGSNDSIALNSASNSHHSRHNSGLEGIIIDAANTNTEKKCVIENISTFLSSTSRRLRLSHSAGFSSIPREQLAEIKKKKRVISQGTELFNQKPDKGIQYLQANGIFNEQLDATEVALFLRENPSLDKKMIGEYISKKKNVDLKILMSFVDSFDFAGLRVDQALRLYLETFRLPGEAPLIFLVLEHFADHWHKQNGEPFSNTVAAFTLAYAIIMLNVDQHNSNAKRLNIPMTLEDFIKNLRGVNGGADFDQDMLSTVFSAIKNEEIVMPAEQIGLVRENYLWKVLLRRGATADGVFNYVEDSAYDLDIFQIIWGASLSALSFMFDKSSENGYQRTLTGFVKSAGISAHYNLHADFDALILTLCKFTTLLNTVQADAVTNPLHNDIVQAVNFGLNPKAQAAIKTVFVLVHEYGDCLREGWKSILEVNLQLFRLKLLPKSLMEVEDFCESSGKVQLIIEKPSQKQEAGLFSSLYSYLSSEGQREPSYEEQEFIKIGKKCVKDCQLDQMIQELKFVQLESLEELLKTILSLIRAPNSHKSDGLPYAEDVIVFWMEFLVKIVIHNRDRMIPLWPSVSDQMYFLLMGSASYGYNYLLNRSIVAVLKLAIYLMRNEELCPIILQSLKMLLMLKPDILLRISKQISIGIYELLKTSAQNIHSEQDWKIIFSILECVGAGAVPPELEGAVLPALNCFRSDCVLGSGEDSGLPDHSYISDSDVATIQQKSMSQTESNSSSPFIPSSPTTENWILVNKETALSTLSRSQSPPVSASAQVSMLAYNCTLMEHSPFALFKSWDSLAFIVRNVAHITPYNFESCVRCIRTFVEASRDGGIQQRGKLDVETKANDQKKKSSVVKRNDREPQIKSSADTLASAQSETEVDDLPHRYETLSIQLLDLMYTLYTRTAQIFRWWAEEECTVPQCSVLWEQGWCPLLQGIARLAMDRRREVRTYAISCLQQRALLVHDLQTLSGSEWASCFKQVLFPLLNELLPESTSVTYLDMVLLEESRIRTATIMSKVFLHHLTPLIELGPLFNELWIEVLDYIDKFMKVGSDMLSEQMQEILKNMLLVMHSVRVFHNNDGTLCLPLWNLTWNRIGEFLPNLKNDLFSGEESQAQIMTPTDDTKLDNISYVATFKCQQPTLTEVTALHTPIVSSMESPRHSIILQPPEVHVLQGPSYVLEQVPVSHQMPVLVPQKQRKQLHYSLPKTSSVQLDFNAHSPLLMRPTPHQPISISSASNIVTSEASGVSLLLSLRDMGNASEVADHISTVSSQMISEDKVAFPESQNQRNQLSTTSGDTIVNSYNSKEFLIELPDTPPVKEVAAQRHERLQQHYHQYYQQNLLQHQLQTVASALSTSTTQHSASSGTITGFQIPNTTIVRSFVPVGPQMQIQQRNGAEIYEEYVENPYNLTLKSQHHPTEVFIASEQLPTLQQPMMTQSPTNYFRSNVDPAVIPPGSELLYGQL